MSERRRRLALWAGLLALTLLLFTPKGHETPPGGAPVVAFFHDRNPGTITVRLAGDVPHPGIYQVAPAATVGELIREAAPGLRLEPTVDGNTSPPLADGDVVTVTAGEGRGVSIARGWMPAGERIVLGVPLDPARMTAADWEALPGIGPALAARIMTLARHRGGIRTLDDLCGVSGIGGRTIEKLRTLFNGSIQNPGVRCQEKCDNRTTH